MAPWGAKWEPSCEPLTPWYVPLALEGRRLHLAMACACALALGSCGGGERQDEDEPEGTFKVQVTKASFPSGQRLAKRSELEIKVRSAETQRVIPNIAVTVRGFDERLEDTNLSDPNRPVFVINGQPKDIGTFPESKEAAPPGGETAYVGTWALGKLRPGQTKTFKWSVTAVRPGAYKITYRVAAGLDGKAEAVDSEGRPLRGLFIGTVDDTPPDTRIAEDGKTIVEGLR